ncbi:hypothetical protein KU406_23160, partial [Salmonella enterica subsp. enterica serovar Montevideo]|nr:hypothetical protein [Salmonella enterica subsp. enterica serovar Montevideo]
GCVSLVDCPLPMAPVLFGTSSTMLVISGTVGARVSTTIVKPLATGNHVACRVDTTAPQTPILTSVVDDVAGGVTGNLANGQITNDNRPTLNGT